jgi:hypothetical protein
MLLPLGGEFHKGVKKLLYSPNVLKFYPNNISTFTPLYNVLCQVSSLELFHMPVGSNHRASCTFTKSN